jgi:hypothetical protein
MSMFVCEKGLEIKKGLKLLACGKIGPAFNKKEEAVVEVLYDAKDNGWIPPVIKDTSGSNIGPNVDIPPMKK